MDFQIIQAQLLNQACTSRLDTYRFYKTRKRYHKQNGLITQIEEVKYEEVVWAQSRQVLLQRLVDQMKTGEALVQQMVPVVKQYILYICSVRIYM